MVSAKRLLAAYIASSVLIGCVYGTGDCSGEGVYAVRANITDSVTAAPLAYRASLIIRDGAYVDSVAFAGTVVRASLLAERCRIGSAPLTTGFGGGYTTFSTFSYETLMLIEAGDYRRASLYALLSVILWVAGAALGVFAAGELLARRAA